MLGYRSIFHLVIRNWCGLYRTSTIIPLQTKLKAHTAICQRAASDKAVTPVLATPAAASVDILLEQLQKAKNLDRVMELVSLHHDVMNTRQLTTAFQQLYSLIKENNMSHEDIASNPSFVLLCDWTMKRARFFDTEEVVTIFRTLSYIGISSTSAVMQTMLQMLRYGINNLTLSQIIFVNFILSKQKTTPLVDAMRIALPLVLQAQVDLQLDSDRLPEVVNCLHTLSSGTSNLSTIEKLVEVLAKKNRLLTPSQAYQICLSLLHLHTLSDTCLDLLQVSLSTVAQSIDEFKTKQLISLLISMQKKNISHNSLFAAISKKALAEKWNFRDIYSILRSFCLFEYVSTELLDYIAELLISQPDLMSWDKISLLTLVEAYALPGYQPPQAEALWKMLSSSEEKINHLKVNFPQLLVKLVSCLAMVGHFPSDLLSLALNENFLSEVYLMSQRKGKMSLFLKDLLYIDWAIKAENLNYLGELIPSTYLKEAIRSEVDHESEPSLVGKYLEISLGGPQFLGENVWTKYGHKFNHVLVIRKGNYPMAVNFKESTEPADDSCDMKFVEDIIHPLDAKIVGIIVADQDCFCRYPEITKGWMKLKLHSLSKLGYYPILVDLASWNNLLDREKIPYLMREIKETISQSDDFTEGASPAV